jgi:trigger factor
VLAAAGVVPVELPPILEVVMPEDSSSSIPADEQGASGEGGVATASNISVTGTPGAAGEEAAFEYDIKVEDAGPATKRVSVAIPPDRIATKLSEQFRDLRREAAVPGFRPGHAPQKLIERKFQGEVREQVRRALISESYEQAVQRNGLQVIGEPEFDNPDAIKLPEDAGGLNYSFQVEVQPLIVLPDLSGLKIKKPKIVVSDENVEQAMQNLREQQGRLIPVEDRGVEAKDHLVVDVQLNVGEQLIGEKHEAPLVVRPGRIADIDVVDLDKQLIDAKVGETRTIKVQVPDTHLDQRIAGKEVQIHITVKDIKRLELAQIDETFLNDLGFANENELREALREQMVERVNNDIQQAMREQVHRHLLDSVQLDLPAKLSDRQVERAVSRRSVDLLLRGVPAEQVQAGAEQLRNASREESLRELKLFFILQRLAEEQGVDVDESELNGRIAHVAAQRDERPERLKQEMAQDGSLTQLYVLMREHKAVDKVLEKAQIEEVDLQA